MSRYIPLHANYNLLASGELKLSSMRASCAWWLLQSIRRTERRTWPIATVAQVPSGFPNSPRIPVWSVSALAHESILLILRTWKWCSLTLKWNASLSSEFRHVLVASNPGSLQRLTQDILLLPTNQMHTERKLINTFLLHANIINPDLGIRNTVAKPRFLVWFVFNLSATSCRS